MPQIDQLKPISDAAELTVPSEKTKEEILAELQEQLATLRDRLSAIFNNFDITDLLNQGVAEELTHYFRAFINDDLLLQIAKEKKANRKTLSEMLAYSLDTLQGKLRQSQERATSLEIVITQWLDLRFLITRLFSDAQLLQHGDPKKTKALLDEFTISTDQLRTLPNAFTYFTQDKIQKDNAVYEFHLSNIKAMLQTISVIEQYQSTYESIVAAPHISEEEREAVLFALLIPAELIGAPYNHWPEEFMQYYNANPWLKEKVAELFPDRAREFVPPIEQRLSKRDQALFKLLENFQQLESGAIDITTLLPFSQTDKPYGVTIKWQNQFLGENRQTTKALVDAVLDGGNEPLQLNPDSNHYEPFTFTVAPILTPEEKVVIDQDATARKEHEQKNPTYSIELRLYTLQSIKPDKEGFFLLTHGSLHGMHILCTYLIDSINYPISIEEAHGENRFIHFNSSRTLARQRGLLS